MTQIPPEDPTHHIPSKEDTANKVRVVRSDELLSGDSEILIRHGSEVYRLRVTRSGKLILTK